jgi:hypothetical protein
MRASVISMSARREGAYVLLEAPLRGAAPKNMRVLLIDPAADRAWVRMRERYEDFAGDEDAEVLEALEEDIRQQAAAQGAEACLRSLEDPLSNVVRVSERQEGAVDAFARVLDRLFDQHVEKIAVQPFRPHLPLYNLCAASGRLG